MTKDDLTYIYTSRPFKTRNADEYDLENILDLFIDPTEGLIGPFEYSNSIIKGKMGSGKTMYLRANYAYYLYTLVPCLIEQSPIILPVYIKLSDFQNLHDPEKIYSAIIIKIIEEIVSVCNHLRSAQELARLHTGAQTLPGLWSTGNDSLYILDSLKKLTAEEYVETITNSFATSGSLTSTFFNACSNYEKENVSQIKHKRKPSFQNIVDTCETLLSPFNGKLLILFDEVGSTSKSFFRNQTDGDSYFETLMNQLRTLPNVRTKLAVYPHSYSDILMETRYGDIIELEYDVTNNIEQYNSSMEKTVSLIERYIEKACNKRYSIEDVFDVSSSNQLIVEHLVNASSGNMRRLVHILDSSMDIAYRRCHGKERIITEDIVNALKKQAAEMENLFQEDDKIFLSKLVKLCRNRSTYRFTFSNRSSYMGKYTSMSSEFNIINISQAGVGRKKTVYSFDYAYCIFQDIPTHYIQDSEKIDKSRSSIHGEIIRRVAQLSDELLVQSDIKGKLEAEITYISKDGQSGFAECNTNGISYYISMEHVLLSEQYEKFYVGKKILLLPKKVSENTFMGTCIEIL